jgi:tetrahydromethanopterin S-methyltransferase subunit A
VSIRFRIEEAAGFACKLLYPIPTSSFKGNGDSIAICTLSSIDLLKKISKDRMMEKVVIAGRLFSENKGIDCLVTFCVQSLDMKYLLICGRDTKGHYPGDALTNLMDNGTDSRGRIINSIAPYPYLTVNTDLIDKFRKRIQVIDMRGCFDLDKIRNKIDDIT